MQRHFLDPSTHTIPDGTHGYVLFDMAESFPTQSITIGADCNLLIVLFSHRAKQTITFSSIGERSRIHFLSLTLGTGNLEFIGNLTEKGSRLDILLLGLTNNDAELTLSGELSIKAWNESLEGSIYQEIILLENPKKIHSFPTLKLEWEGATGRHGLSIHRLSDATLFFLTSRGIDKKDALRILILWKITSFFGNHHSQDLLDLCKKHIQSSLL